MNCFGELGRGLAVTGSAGDVMAVEATFDGVVVSKCLLPPSSGPGEDLLRGKRGLCGIRSGSGRTVLGGETCSPLKIVHCR